MDRGPPTRRLSHEASVGSLPLPFRAVVPRVLVSVGLAVAVLLLLVGAATWLAYGTSPTREGELDVDGLSAPVIVAWSDTSGVTVEAATLADLAAGLGYAHAADHAWPMAWLRQNARGTTAEWFGDSLRTRDLHARRMGFDATARAAYAALSPADRALFDAYARGVNIALAEPGVAQSDAFVLLDVAPEPWQPWDAIAVEHLIAWTGTPAPWTDASFRSAADSLRADSTASDASPWAAARRASPAVRAFARADSSFRAGLGLGGMAHGRVFAAPSSEGQTLVQHHVMGTTAADLLVPARLVVDGRATLALTVPGTLLLPGGATRGGAWGLLLTSRTTVEPFADEPPPAVFSRIVERDGDETLVGARRDSSGLVIGRAARRVPARTDTTTSASDAPVSSALAASASTTAQRTPVADSTTAAATTGRWRIGWAGFAASTDQPALFRIAAGGSLSVPTVLAGTGLFASRDDVRVLGAPRVAVQADGLAFVSDALAARPAADRLARLSRFDPWPLTLATDALSATAVAALRPMLDALGDRDSLATVLQEPYSFLASWGGMYTSDAIGATLYAAWLDAHESITGRRPDPADSLDRQLLPYTLRLARADLRDRRGPDPLDWRWGATTPGPQYPVLGRLRGVAARPFQLAEEGDGGAPDALFPGPAPGSDAGAAVWTAWVSLRDGRLYVRAPRRRRVTEDRVETPAEVRGRTTVLSPGVAVRGDRLTLRPSALP